MGETRSIRPAAMPSQEVGIAETPPPRRPHQWPTIGLFLLGATGALIYAQTLLMPVVFAFLLALTFSPVRRLASRAGIPSGISAALIVVSLFALIMVLVVALSQPVRHYVADAPQLLREAELKLSAISSTVENVAEASEEVEKLANGEEEEEAQTVVIKEPSAVAKLATTAPQVLAQVVLVLVLLFFILASGDMFYEKTVHSIGRFKDKRRAVNIFRDIEGKLSRYFFIITIINAGLGVAVGCAMWALGMPNPLLFGVLAFIFNFVPYIGAIAGVVLSFGVGLVTFDTIWEAVIAGFVYFFLTTMEGQFITPYAVGRSLKLNTVVVFLAVAFWGWLWSVIGMIVAMPLLIAVKVFADHVPPLHGFSNFLSARHAENEHPKQDG
ncbi:MAG: AI-2E family transporter [Parvularcula sp.]|jgi:predicted PurR-regulated permease PerM|nr:AI-2E family transporter [Parvularcula sp.]